MCHETVDVSYKVDKNIAVIIDYINNKYCHNILTHACCEDNNGKAYISMYPKTLEVFDEMVEDVFGDVKDRDAINLQVYYMNNGFSRIFDVRWSHKKYISERCERKLERFLETDNRKGYR